MPMDCSKCLNECRGECCSEVPMPAAFLKRHTPVREITEVVEYGGSVVAKTASGRCPFLTEDYKCSVYSDRPAICRVFGDDLTPFSKCRWQDKDGRPRSRQERRALAREFEDRLKHLKRAISTGDRSASFMTEREKDAHNASHRSMYRLMPRWERLDLYRKAAVKFIGLMMARLRR